jgi:omega-amidase
LNPSTLTFTIVQTNIVWENIEANLQMLTQKIESIATPTQIVVLPEMFTTGFSMQPHLYAQTTHQTCIQWMQKMAAQHKIIITGSVMIKEENNYYNRLIWMQPNGEYHYYNKRHCFAYANEHNHYTAGNKKLIVQANGFKINLQICYDLRFPVWSRQADKNNLFDVLIYVANWPTQRNHAWKSLLIARAIENQCYVIGVNRVGIDGNHIEYNGDSMIVSPLGKILYHKQVDEDIFTITLNKEDINTIRNQFPFYNDADEFLIK